MSDVLAMIESLRARLWSEYGDPLVRSRNQDEIHMTYYVGELLKRRGHKWFKAEGVSGACYTEAAMHDAFTAGMRLGERKAEGLADRIVAERLEAAREALG